MMKQAKKVQSKPEAGSKLYQMNILTAVMITAVLFASLFLSIHTYLSCDFNQYDNEIRLSVAEQKNLIEDGIYKSGFYPYIVFDLSGKVLYSEPSFDEKPGDIVNVQEMLQFDKSYAAENPDTIKESFVLQNDGITTGFVVFSVPKSDAVKSTNKNQLFSIFLPLLFGVMLSTTLILARTIYCNRRILNPLKEISASAKGIITGNYDLEILRTYGRTANENEVGNLSYAFELMRDELKAKQIKEEELKKSQQELISCISHDLKTPISTIKAYSEGLRDNIAKSPKQQEEFVGIIINKTDLLISMINELLEFSNAQLMQLEIARKEIYFLDYFIPLMEELEIYVKQNGLDFSYEINLGNLIVFIDSRRITEVIYNLVENSIKYMDKKNGKIRITAERQDKAVLIRVIDNGAGISSDDIPYVFDKFYRAEKSRSTSVPGSGLGLSICKYIINEHGGEIYCKSSSKKGCEIGFTLQ
jgi:signal transduction histidine kinase